MNIRDLETSYWKWLLTQKQNSITTFSPKDKWALRCLLQLRHKVSLNFCQWTTKKLNVFKSTFECLKDCLFGLFIDFDSNSF
jgi:hypothetical protein